ncbi:MAG TPA: 2-C-methyl-D-erythritol 4-phosphate cytidylyltransferase [Candidatus Omnitrophica bacterium]|nr:2-C-methyl-D-erythritol 4-phosphate cytidylyltransferase [Candidatus Omnitrophota bacterium]
MLDGQKITALVAAGGLGLRMNLDLAKPLVHVKDKPIIIYTLEALNAHPLIDEVVLIFNKDGVLSARDFVKKYNISKVSRVIEGGSTRKESVSRGLDVVDSKTRLVVIHDGVRPFVDEGSITRVIEAAKVTGAAVLGVPVKPTIKLVDRNQDVESTLRRESLWEIQTPQVFERELIQMAYLRASKHAVPDDAALVELMGRKVRVVLGSYFNIKITTQEDLVFAEAIAGIKAIE